MKLFKTCILFLTLIVATISCNKDDDSGGNSSNEDNIVGTWRLIKEISHEVGTEDIIYNVPDGCDEFIFCFSSDNTFTGTSDWDCDGIIDDSGSGTYYVEGDMLVIDDNESESAKIITLNSTTLRIRLEEDTDGNYYEDLVFERISNDADCG